MGEFTERRELPKDYGSAIADVRDLRDEGVPLPEIRAALAKLHPEAKAPVAGNGETADTK